MTSKVVTVAVDGLTASVAEAKALDIVTTVFSTNSALTGVMGLGQRVALFVGGMAVQNNRLGRGWNPFSPI